MRKQNFAFWQNGSDDFKYDNNFSKLHSKYTHQIRYFLVQSLTFFVLQETLHFDKLATIYLKYDDNRLSKLPLSKVPRWGVFVTNFDVILFWTKLPEKNSGALISNMTLDFQKCISKIPKEGVFSLRFSVFSYYMKFCH